MSRPFKHQVTDSGAHQFLMRTPEEGEHLIFTVNSEGIVVDVTDKEGEVIGTSYTFWDDLEEMARDNNE